MIYNEQPDNFIPDMEVVGCSVNLDGKILLLQYGDHKTQASRWGCPAGKVNKDDSDTISAMIRELFEETGLIAKKEELIFHKTFYVSHLGHNFYYHYFGYDLNSPIEITISDSEHKAFTWVQPKEALEFPLILDEDHCIKFVYGN